MHLFLSPHCDDVALSCGGRASQLAAAGETVRVLTVMSGLAPDDDLSPFARAHHSRWGRPGDRVAARQLRLAEDACALDALGVQGDYLDWLDAIYRKEGGRRGAWLYTSNDTLFAPLHPSERPLAERLADDILAYLGPERGGIVYAPLAVGSHVDHQLVRHASLLLWQRGLAVRFYEELPYAEEAGRVAAALSEPAGTLWVGEVYRLDERALAARVAAVGCYVSQLVGLFGDATSYPQRVRAYAEKVGAGAGPAERLWRLEMKES